MSDKISAAADKLSLAAQNLDNTLKNLFGRDLNKEAIRGTGWGPDSERPKVPERSSWHHQWSNTNQTSVTLSWGPCTVLPEVFIISCRYLLNGSGHVATLQLDLSNDPTFSDIGSAPIANTSAKRESGSNGLRIQVPIISHQFLALTPTFSILAQAYLQIPCRFLHARTLLNGQGNTITNHWTSVCWLGR